MFDHTQATHPHTRVRRSLWRVTVAAALCAASSATLGVASLPRQEVHAVAGNPRTPGNPTTVWTENFEHNSSANTPTPVNITSYTGATGMTYTASPFWSSQLACNGMVLTQLSQPDVVPGVGIPSTLCGGSWEAWIDLRNLSKKLTNRFGQPGDLFTIASYTAGEGTGPSDYVQLQSKAIPVSPGGVFLTTAVDTAAYNCQASGPQYWMYLTDASGTRRPVVDGAINPCTDSKATIDSSIDSHPAYIARSVGNLPALVNSTSVAVTLENQNVTGFGNDATFDNLQLFDVTPQLDKSFSPTLTTYGSTSTATFTITNTYSPAGDGSFTRLDPKIGWSFTDALPSGLTIVGSPTTGAGAEACANFTSAVTNPSLFVAKGDLSAGQAYCTVLVQVKASAPGSYTNLASSVTTTGLQKPLDASVTFTAAPAIALKKSAVVTDTNTNGITDAGDQLAYSFAVTNTGNVALSGVAVTDAKVGAVTCNPTTIPVGASIVCTANNPYVLTLADVTAGKVDNTASVSGTDAFSGAKVTATDTLTTPISPAPKLTLTKTAGTPVDVNNSTLTDAGDTIPFTFKVTNTGNVALTSITVDDPSLGGPVTCVPTSLDPNQSADCTGSHTVTAADQAATLYINKATAHGKTPAGVDTASNEATTTTPIQVPAPSLLLKKTAGAPADKNGSGIVDAGDTIQFSFTITNTGNVPVTTVTVSDPLVGAVTCPPSVVAPNGSVTCTADAPYVITKADQAAGTVKNTATSSALAPDGSKVNSNPDSTSTPVLVPAPKLLFEKFASAPKDVNASTITDAGDEITYTFKVTNNGNVPVTNVAVLDDKVGAVTCTPTALAVGAVANCTAAKPYVITKADEGTKAVRNTASATALDPDNGTVTSNTANTVTPVETPAPALQFTKSAGDPVDVNSSLIPDAGDTIQYRFTVTNTGNVPLSAIRVDDPKAGPATCDKTILAPKQTATCVADKPYVVTAADVSANAARNTATAYGTPPTGTEVPSNTASTTTPLVAPAPSMLLTKSADTPTDANQSGLVDAGDTIQYRFTVTNTGNVPISSVTVNDPLAGAVTCQATALAVGATTTCSANAVYVITAKDQTAGRVDNIATASAVNPDGGTFSSNTAQATSPVALPNPSVTLDKVAAPPVDVNKSGLTDAGDTIQYTFTVTNNGNVPLVSIAVTDPLVGAVTCEATSLAVGKATTCKADKVYTITQADQTAGSVLNSATAAGVDPSGGPVTSKPSTTNTVVKTPTPSLLFTKSAAAPVDANKSGVRDAGDTIQYTFTVTNTGNVPMTKIAVNDPKVGAVTCESTELAVGKATDCRADTVYTITLADQTSGSVVNVALASGQNPDGTTTNSNNAETTTPLTQPKPSLSFEKFASAPTDKNGTGIIDAGDVIRFSFKVTNTGNIPVTAIKVNDPLVGAVTCASSSLAVGATTDCVAGDYTITDKDQNGGAVKNVANATGTDPSGATVTSNSDDTNTAVVQPTPRLALIKEATDSSGATRSSSYSAGDTIIYRFTVYNNGNVVVNNITISDPMIGSSTCQASTLAVGASTVCRADKPYTVTAANATAGNVQNTATATGRLGNGQTTSSPPASVTVTVVEPGVIPSTGSRPTILAGSGLMLILVGGLGLLIVRRRPRHAGSAL